jgi:hypothetical protein
VITSLIVLKKLTFAVDGFYVAKFKVGKRVKKAAAEEEEEETMAISQDGVLVPQSQADKPAFGDDEALIEGERLIV